MVIAKRVFGASDQNHFASLSGDRNPMHMDPVAARRTQAGAPVVHGVHAVLWALERLFAQGVINQPVASLDARFAKFIYVGAEVDLRIARRTADSLRVELLSEAIVTTTIDITFGAPAPHADPPLGTQRSPYGDPADLGLSDISDRSGILKGPDRSEIERAFPAAATGIGGTRVESIAGLSLLVGMVCPGLHSIFSSFAIATVEETAQNSDLTFATSKVDPRFRMVEIAVSGGGIYGSVTAFVRQPPVAQRTLTELREIVRPNEFARCNALVVGGSRGLGALTAKIITAGGGRVAITYASGEADAREVAHELALDSASVLRYDAREDAISQIRQLGRDVNQLYYFATTHISRQKPSGYSPTRFAEFSRMYVDGFAGICGALRTRGSSQLAVFYPSSIYVGERPRELTEYAMAKAAGETLCADMNRYVRGTSVLVKRLPRLLTDQTATVMPSEISDPLDEMLPIVREMQELL